LDISANGLDTNSSNPADDTSSEAIALSNFPVGRLEGEEKLATTEEKRKGGNLASCPPFPPWWRVSALAKPPHRSQKLL